jgi:hypothetical protein
MSTPEDIPPLPELDELPASIEPRRDLWPDIEHALSDSARARAHRRWRAPRAAWVGVPLAAAASLAIALWPAEQPAPAPAPPPVTEDAPPTDDLAEAFAAYRAAAQKLDAALAERAADLPPETRRVIDDNRRIVDDALRELEHALETSSDPVLVSMAHQAWGQKLALLEAALRASEATHM